MFYGAMKLSVGSTLKLAFRPWAEGLENIPAAGPAILASNHLSFSDSFFLPAVLDRKVTFIAKAEYFTTPGVKGKLTAAFFKGVGQLPVDRSGVRGAGEAAIQSGLEVLERGELFGVYPEGTRSPDGRLYRGKPGALARMALRSGAPVIPVAMIDTEKIQPPGKVVPKLRRPGIRVGEPLDFARYQGMDNDRFIQRAVTDEVMYEILKLSGQEYVDMYATAAKRQIAEAAKAAEAESKADEPDSGRRKLPKPLKRGRAGGAGERARGANSEAESGGAEGRRDAQDGDASAGRGERPAAHAEGAARRDGAGRGEIHPSGESGERKAA